MDWFAWTCLTAITLIVCLTVVVSLTMAVGYYNTRNRLMAQLEEMKYASRILNYHGNEPSNN